MDVSNFTARLSRRQRSLRDLPPEILDILRRGTNAQYLDALSQLALQPSFTTPTFVTHEPIFVEICSKWLTASHEHGLSALAALARIIPSAPYLSLYARALLGKGQHGTLEALTSGNSSALQDLPVENLHTLLLALCRLLAFDNAAYASVVSPAQLQLLLKHQHLGIRYLAIKIFCLYLHASDAALTAMIKTYIGEDEIQGQWEDKSIDYTFFDLWEDQRLNELSRALSECQEVEKICLNRNHGPSPERSIECVDLSRTTACIGGVLLSRLNGADPRVSSIFMTETMKKNMERLARGVKSSKPLLVTGFSGAGKTLLVNDIARELGKSSDMVILHLNEQTDVKLLIGMYTSQTPGSFSWRPGVLTTAVLDGRWVLIEDLDRAPTEIISTLLPLLERGELLVPNWGETIRAAAGFKVIATVRSARNSRGEEYNPASNMIGIHHWLQVEFHIPRNEELAHIAAKNYPILRAHLPKFMAVYQNLLGMSSSHTGTEISHVSPSLGPQDLLKWCSRVEVLLQSAGIGSDHEPISDTTSDNIFLEATDCFIGAFPSGAVRSHCIDVIAQGLHMPTDRARYCLSARKPECRSKEATFQIGRACLPKRKPVVDKRPTRKSEGTPFALTNHVLRFLESVAVAVKQAEPCLLVGETGTGKTAIVQRLADLLDRKLTVVNLSQQSEAGDLLGGFKPANIRALAVPMKEEFDELMTLTFSSKRNQHFVDALGKSVSKGRWLRALTLWQEALRMIESHLKPASFTTESTNVEPISKRRRLQSPKIQKLQSRWAKFASEVHTFHMNLSSGSRGFAFSFVEGNIIKAARNGDWVLLDEINLASPDTLESLADLFSHGIDSSPSILLTETGDTTRIHAHKDFRIFGAMNPATDVGKRDLPLSLRTKFTVLFMEAPDKDLENLVPIVKAYLGNHNHVDVRAATDVANVYLDIKKLADKNLLVDGANQKPHFSLRTLSRTLVYVLDIAPIYGLRRALFEGFSMSFLTVLNKESELLLQPLIERHILGSQKNSTAILHQTPRLPQDGKPYVQFRHYWVAQGASLTEEQSHYIITPFIERNLLNLVRATSTRRFPVLLQGPTSSGKTSMIEYLACISGNKFVRINNHEHTDLQEYLGTYVSGPDGQLHFQEGILVHALRQGYWVVLDELNLAPTDVLEALNRLLDDNRELLIPETQDIVRPHENFMLFATQNPPGMYGGRKVLSRAFRNRFLELHFDEIPEEELETILRERSQIAPSFCTKIVAVYKKLSILRQSDRLFEQKNSFATLRDLFRWALRDADDREQLAVNGFLLLAERVRKQQERIAVKGIIEDVMKVKIDLDRVYDIERIAGFPGISLSSTKRIVWTESMRRLFFLVAEALRNNEPVLLVGETGSGKTTVCQAIAEMSNTVLHIVNAQQNMETADLIGAQRPIRNKALAESQLAQELTAVFKDREAYSQISGHDLNSLLNAYEEVQRQSPAWLTPETSLRIEQLRIKASALFEWADGSLVHAMKQGHPFLLDEISLADDSVLERLNSVLEPGRTLLLAEKGTNDACVNALPGFQFLATMNPGGDYGKRELSPALRNRFTEIWVPSALNEEEMFEIAQANLVPSVADFAKPMVDFATWFSMTYSPGASHISIRDLLSWIQFVNTSQLSGPYHVLLHGAAMVYIDGLGANPASKLSIVSGKVAHERSACVTKLGNLFFYDMLSIYNSDCQIMMSNTALSIGPFSLAKKSCNLVSNFGYSLQAPTTTMNAMKILRALHIQKPILLEGSPGVGKTTLVAALAQAIGMPLTRINLSDQTDLMDLFGSDVPVEGAEAGTFGWRDAPFLRAMQKGEWVLLDEMNLASQSILEGLNACFDHRGQVYVSELDQTFERHPDFVVFAAQNPHHQGGGRKGLPASFVNRFTVVYADTFNAKDMFTISSQMYPQVPHDLTENILKAVDALSQLLQQNKNVGAHGGPWEINLRDVLRWLQLMTSRGGLMPAAKAADFLRLLFLQRFRTPEDVATISKTLHRFLPPQHTRTYYNAKSEHWVEVGLGLLPRNKLVRPISSQGKMDMSPNLPIAESVMLCIESRWPCLLVGPSGSGKTQLIMQLASAVGTDVVDLSLNSEMDTMDLVGGYEQLDPRRENARFVNQLKAYTRKNLVLQLASASEFSISITRLEHRLRDSAVPLSEVHELIQTAVEDHPSSMFPDFLVKCQRLMQQSNKDNRARFEWVDGILIKALKQGKWLILDNANLCNPSVLDRLNSLLEPNGFLSINEHRNADGSAQVITPHMDFRLFLTMDPRHGELSRAMRNRSVELFMPLISPSPVKDVLSSNVDPTVSRFALFNAFNWKALADIRVNEILAICLDHLTFQDLVKMSRWQTQIVMGLNDFSSANQARLSYLVNSYEQILGSNSVILNSIGEMYDRISGDLGTSSSLGMLQSVHPYNNPILLSDKRRTHLSGKLRWFGDCFELLLAIYGYGQQLTLAAEAAQLKQPSHMSRLERSLASVENKNFQSDSTQPLALFLQDMGLYLRNLVVNKVFVGAEDGENGFISAQELLLLLKDIFDLSQSSEFDEGVFQVYQTLGRSMVARNIEHGESQSLSVGIAHAMRLKFDTFKSSWQLFSGLRMEQLWQTFRPAVASSLWQVESSLQVRKLAARFDDLKWSSGASLQELDSLRNSIVRIHDTILASSSHSFGPLEDVERSIEQLTSHDGALQADIVPYFHSQFEALCQYEVCANGRAPFEASTLISLLAGRPTAQLMTYGKASETWRSLAQVPRITASSQKFTQLATIRSLLPVTILHKLGGINEVPLQSLDLLSSELSVLGTTVAGLTDEISEDSLRALKHVVENLREQVVKTLSMSVSSEVFESIKSHIAQLPLRLNTKAPDQGKFFEQIGHFHQCIASVVGSRTASLVVNELVRTSSDCIQFFTGCLILYVPDRVFDPALRPMVERSRHNKRKAEMQNKLQALQDFEMVFTGQQSSFRIQLIEQGLQALGAEPQVPSIVRPRISELGQLQAEFDNILKTILMRSPNASTVEQVSSGQEAQTQETKLLRANIAQAVVRLSNSFPTYEDIIKPLIAMLQGLDVGLALALLAGVPTSEGNNTIRQLCATTVFLGAGPHDISNPKISNSNGKSAQVLDPYSQYLSSFALARSVSADLEESSTQGVFQAFHTLYAEWKENLGHDQRQNVAKSSMYRYRGSEGDSNEADEQDFQQLFPHYSDAPRDTTRPTGAGYDPKEQAMRLAELQRQIFQSTDKTSIRILDLLRRASHTIGRAWQGDLELSMAPVQSKDLLSAVILSLEEHHARLHDQAAVGNLHNFYTDANLPEVQKLITLVHTVQMKFIDLQEAWPEHATLEDVLRTSSELLTLRHTEPIAKLLTKAEQLHSYIYEWQIVASKQYTAASLYDQLTDLLVSWRRLELTTWARLLAMEDQKCHDDADSWWFVAYESIIAAPLSMVDAGEDLRPHAEQMFSTLSNFLATTSMGQYSHHLGMIECFKSHLELLVRQFPSMSIIHNALANLLSFYSRFKDSIQESMRKGRQSLEKDMKEILLLASWKDTNIAALRDSAKRSHHKLFKIVRKYRMLLAQDSIMVLSQSLPDKLEDPVVSLAPNTTVVFATVDSRALQLCHECIDGWQTKPDRFTDPSTTANRMLHMSQLPLSVIDGASYLDSYGTELLDNIKALQKETPTAATKENTEAIKHLKVRKRKLYAETLKDLRQMGFHSNLNAGVLAKQESVSIILTCSPAFADQNFASNLHAAEYYFHKLLNIMPQLKQHLRTHSEDLTNGEVARSLGYLESMMSMLLRQRIVLAAAMSDASQLDKTLRKVQNMWAPDSHIISKCLQGKDVEKETHCTLKWLPGILEAGSVIAQKHARMGKHDACPIVESLSQWRGQIEAFLRTISTLPDLPVGLSSSKHETNLRDGERLLQGLQADLHRLIEENSGSAFVLSQIEQWTNVKLVLGQKVANGEQLLSLKFFESSLSAVSDSVLVALQRMREAYSTMPTSDEHLAWLTCSDTSSSTALGELHANEVNTLLNDTLSDLCHLDSTDEDSLKVVGALCAMTIPIVSQYRDIHRAALGRYVNFHESLCKLASLVAHSFSRIAQEGFCTPVENGVSEAGTTEKLEGGTGLGEGEGAEDISKDIQDDEDLSELAQQRNKDDMKEDVEDQEDAVNMDLDELEGEMGNVSDKEDDDGSASEDGEDDIDEEAGDVDDLDPSAVDEKLWDGKTDETEKEKEGSKKRKKTENDDQAAANGTERQEDVPETDKEEDDNTSQEGAEEGAEESEQIAREETEKMDPHAQDGQNLDLPEEMDLDDADGTDAVAESGDSDLDAMSDVDQEPIDDERSQQADEDDRADAWGKEQTPPEDRLEDDVQEELATKDVGEAASLVDTDPSDDGQDDDQGLLQDISDNAANDPENTAPSDVKGPGQDIEQRGDEKAAAGGQAQASEGTKRSSPSLDATETAAEDGGLGDSKAGSKGTDVQDERMNPSQPRQAFQKLGNALEKWHRQQRQIQDASEHGTDPEQITADPNMANQDFEHVQNEEEADTQAMGATTQESAKGLDEKGRDLAMLGNGDEAENLEPEVANQEGAEHQDEAIRDYEAATRGSGHQQEQSQPGLLITNNLEHSRRQDEAEAGANYADEEIERLDNELSTTHIQNSSQRCSRSVEEARQLWSHYESITRDLSRSLTEELRLILAPTIATKMRGDFRTGKRLNIKRIIPYIASQYKRDKIWMRRSIPSKRNYQIMLAIDDSKSMGEGGNYHLAFESVALVVKALTMLEAGEISVVAFGSKIQIAHPFEKPFWGEGGAEIFQHFGFQQTETNVRKLVAESIQLFREARRKTFNTGTELWQLELIISDGVCEDHESIKRLVRQAQNERIMVVFVIVDTLGREESILSMNQAAFESNPGGELKLNIKRYLDTFPFPYYVVVGNIRELPGVLAQALRQWFAEIVGEGGSA